MSDEATKIVMTETERDLLNEVRDQYEKKTQYFKESGGNPSTRTGKMICHIPYEMLREAFEGQPPLKE